MTALFETVLRVTPEIEALRGMTVGILGATGLIGSALVETLLQANSLPDAPPIMVCGMARRPTNALPDTPSFRFVPLSVMEVNLARKLPPCDYLIYIAGTASDYRERPQETLETQTLGLERVLSAAPNIRKFVYISSTRVYGRETGAETVTEEFAATVPPMHLDNLYDSAKRLGESLCLWYAERGRCPATVARLSNLYGLSRTVRSETVITDFVRQAAQTGRIVPKGSPLTVRNYCATLDIVQGLLKMLTRGEPGRAYNLASREHLTVRDLAEQIAAAMPTPVETDWSQASPHVSIQRVSIERAESELDYQPQFRFAALAPQIVRQTRDALAAS